MPLGGAATRPRRLAGALVLPAVAVAVAGCGDNAGQRSLKSYLTSIRPLVERGVKISEDLKRDNQQIPNRRDAGLVRDLQGVASSYAKLERDLERAQPADPGLARVHRHLVVAVELRRRIALLLAKAVRDQLQAPANEAGELVSKARRQESAFQKGLLALGRARSVGIRVVTVRTSG